MTTFLLPDLGEGLQEAEIVAWHVAVGDNVVADQPLLSVETDKAVVEIPSPQSGRIAKLLGQPGDTLPIGATLVEFDEGEAVDAGAIVGEIAAGATKTKTRPRSKAKDFGGAVPHPSTGIKATPAVRALARKFELDLAIVTPTGKDDQITTGDVERAARILAEAGPLEPLRGVRRAMARNMTLAHAEVVPATVSEEADVAAWSGRQDVTMRLIRAIVAGCEASPALNAWYESDKMARRLLRHIDLGIAVNTGDGLFVPVLRDVANRDSADLRDGLNAMKRDVEARTVPLEELRGQTFILSNFGMEAGLFAQLVIPPPQVGILGSGRIHERFVPVDGKPEIHRILPLSLTFDHRAVTGVEAARFLRAVVDDLEMPD